MKFAVGEKVWFNHRWEFKGKPDYTRATVTFVNELAQNYWVRTSRKEWAHVPESALMERTDVQVG